MRILAVVALVACGNSSQPAKEGSAAPVPVVPVPAPVPDATPDPAMVHGISLVATHTSCADLAACGELRGTQKLGDTILQCGVASRIELRRVQERCELAIQGPAGIDIAATDLACPGAHVALGPVECADKAFAITLLVADGDRQQPLRLTCQRTATSLDCAREMLPLTGGKELAAFIAAVKTAVETHKWKVLLALCSPQHKKEQLTEMGMGQAQYIAELFGLHTVGNNLVGDDETIRTEHLARIQSLEIRDIAEAEGSYVVIGYVQLDGGTRLRLAMLIGKENGRFVLTGASG
jgi:hypothetical protein